MWPANIVLWYCIIACHTSENDEKPTLMRSWSQKWTAHLLCGSAHFLLSWTHHQNLVQSSNPTPSSVLIFMTCIYQLSTMIWYMYYFIITIKWTLHNNCSSHFLRAWLHSQSYCITMHLNGLPFGNNWSHVYIGAINYCWIYAIEFKTMTFSSFLLPLLFPLIIHTHPLFSFKTPQYPTKHR